VLHRTPRAQAPHCFVSFLSLFCNFLPAGVVQRPALLATPQSCLAACVIGVARYGAWLLDHEVLVDSCLLVVP